MDIVKRFRTIVGSWAPSEMQKSIDYKARNAGKIIINVNSGHRSQRCSKCGHVNKNNSHGLIFICRNCVFEFNANLNASRKIEVFFIYEY